MNPGSQFKDSDAPNLLANPVVQETAAKYNATVGQVKYYLVGEISECV